MLHHFQRRRVTGIAAPRKKGRCKIPPREGGEHHHSKGGGKAADIISAKVITGSTHPRNVTDWLSEINQASSIHDLDEAKCRSKPWIQKSQQASMKIMSSEFSENKSGGRKQEKKRLPMLTGRPIALKINDVHERATDMNG